MQEESIISLFIILANGIVSYRGFRDHLFLEKYSFRVDRILVAKEYWRIITSGFLHVGWMHLILNMYTLYCFSSGLESLGSGQYLLIYFGSLIGGNLFSLFIHRNHSDYSAVGASGAISGLVFASIALFPGIKIGMIGLPIYIDSWIYGLLYVLVSIYGIKSQRDNVGHDAHLGGGLIGLLIAISIVPNSFTNNYLVILLILVPSVIFIYIIIRKPHSLLVDNLFEKREKLSFEEKYNLQKRNKELELDKLLDKIGKNGMSGLTDKEKERLKDLSGKR